MARAASVVCGHPRATLTNRCLPAGVVARRLVADLGLHRARSEGCLLRPWALLTLRSEARDDDEAEC